MSNHKDFFKVISDINHKKPWTNPRDGNPSNGQTIASTNPEEHLWINIQLIVCWCFCWHMGLLKNSGLGWTIWTFTLFLRPCVLYLDTFGFDFSVDTGIIHWLSNINAKSQSTWPRGFLISKSSPLMDSPLRGKTLMPGELLDILWYANDCILHIYIYTHLEDIPARFHHTLLLFLGIELWLYQVNQSVPFNGDFQRQIQTHTHTQNIIRINTKS